MVIGCGRLGGRWFDSTGRFLFCFWQSLLFFGADRRVARDFCPPEIAIVGDMPVGPKNVPQCQKSHAWLGNSPICDPPCGHSGALFWAYGQIRAAARDLN